ncbi:MAG: SDR family NAD(P)-dependent oxidoreductase [Propionivibrio sp.]
MKTNVTFNSNGFRLAAHLYVPDDFTPGKHPAIVVGHPASGVKEQTAGLYAQRLTERGFITLTFDTATQGESEGLPRGVEDPARRVEEFKDAVSFLCTRVEVDSDHIGVLGICASGGFVVSAAASDHRIKAVATVSGVDLGTWYRIGADGKQDPAVFQSMLDAAAAARTAETLGEGVMMLPIRPADEEQARAGGPMDLDGWQYYCTDNGRHPRQADKLAWTSIDRAATFEGFRFVDLISPRPLLMLVGNEAVTRWMSEAAIKQAHEPKELCWIDGATHVSLYYKPEHVTPAVARLTDFFKASLRRISMDTIPPARFGATSTSDEVLDGIDLSDKRVLVTGVSAGLGVETARVLVAHGAHVVGAARDLDKARRATNGIGGPGKLELVECDLASLASVRACADSLNAKGDEFDVVIANAGLMAAAEKRETVDGFELQFGTNHLGHFVLVNRIARLIKDGGRLVSLSSRGHQRSDVNLDDPSFEHTEYTPFGAYGRSKTANILFAVEFDRRHRNRSVRATAVHPGVIQTELSRHISEGELKRQADAVKASMPKGQHLTSKSIPQGAATSVWAGFVANKDEVGGRYCEDCHVAGFSADEGIGDGVKAYAVDPDNARALWSKSEEMVGEMF